MTRKSSFPRAAVVAGICAALLGAVGVSSASAQSLEEALAQAYANNPTLAAQRAKTRATDEGVAQAKSAYRPTVKMTAQGTQAWSQYEPKSPTSKNYSDSLQKTIGVTVSQSLYDPTAAPGVRAAEAAVQAQRATLTATEQTVLLNAATAYLNVVQFQAVLALNRNNEQVLRRQLDASNDRFRVGEYTRTDVAQSESALAASTATRIQAEGQLASAVGTYERYIGAKPGELKAVKPKFALPKTLDEAIQIAGSNNPNIIAASFQEQAGRHAVDQAFGSLLPTASLQASGSRTFDAVASGSRIDHSDSLQIVGQVIVPIYQSGLPEAKVRAAKQTANQYRIQMVDARDQIAESTISAWQSLATAQASVESYKKQIEAARIALDGVRQEAQVGSKTVLDVLNQEQTLLSARVNLVTSERNEAVASFTLLSALGQLTANRLGLRVTTYDPATNYNQVRDKWTGTDVGE